MKEKDNRESAIYKVLLIMSKRLQTVGMLVMKMNKKDGDDDDDEKGNDQEKTRKAKAHS